MSNSCDDAIMKLTMGLKFELAFVSSNSSLKSFIMDVETLANIFVFNKTTSHKTF